MKTILHIDSSDSGKIQVTLSSNGAIIRRNVASKPGNAQLVLPIIEELLEKNSRTLKDLTDITVNTGPGSFTGLRVGITIAQTLGVILQIPVNGKPPGERIEPLYQ